MPGGTQYDAEYYHSHCGSRPYEKGDAHWEQFFGGVADNLVRCFSPKTVFDAGCAVGFLVEALWDRGVEAHGRDVSSFAIEQVRPDVYVKGGDYTPEMIPEASVVRRLGGQVRVVDYLADRSTSAVLERIRSGGPVETTSDQGT